MTLSEVVHENTKLRIDSAYFGKDVRRLDDLVRAYPNGFVELGEIAGTFKKGIFDIKAETYVDAGVPFIRISNLKGGIIDETGIARIDQDAHLSEQQTKVVRGDLAISKTAYPAASYIQLPEANVSQDVIACSVSKSWKANIQSGFLAAYLNSETGLMLMQRQFQGNVQLYLSLDDGRKIPIPLLSHGLQERVERAFLSAFDKFEHSSELLSQAEQTLLDEMGLAEWSPPEPLTYTRSSRDVLAARRFDSEHFSERHRAIESKLVATGQAALLESLVLVNKRGTQPQYQEEGLPVINSRHVLRGQVALDSENRFASGDAAPLKIQNGDVLLNGTGVGTIGRASPYLHETAAIPDNHVTVLRPNTQMVDPIYLSVFLNSAVGQSQVEKWTRGSSGQIELYPSDIDKFFVWVAPKEVQRSIKDCVKAAFESKQTAMSLLERAKLAVEIAIENGEAAASRYLKES